VRNTTITSKILDIQEPRQVRLKIRKIRYLSDLHLGLANSRKWKPAIAKVISVITAVRLLVGGPEEGERMGHHRIVK
jgi:hypothetical protein